MNRYEGLPGFYKGISANLLKLVISELDAVGCICTFYRVVPATCLTFVVYEYVSSLLQQNI